MEPDYIAQTGEPSHLTSQGAVREWFVARRRAGGEQGMTWFRCSVSEQHHLLLVEGWKVRPEDEGETRWQFTTAQQ